MMNTKNHGLTEFIWKGKDKTRKEFSGNIYALDEKSVRIELRRQGINASRIYKKRTYFSISIKKTNIKSEDIAVFSRQFATMLNAGVPIVQALDIISHSCEKSSMQNLLQQLKIDVESGNSLSKSLQKYPIYFDNLFCNLISVGEQAGILETLLDKIAIYKEKNESVKKKLKKAMIYPASVTAVAIIVSGILLIFVVPVFENLFKSFGADLPIFTKMVIHLSNQVQNYWWLIALLLAVGSYAFLFFKRTSESFNYFLDKQILKIIVIGLVANKSIIARFSRTLSLMSAAGVPLVNSLESVAETCGNRIYRDAVLQIREEVATGQRLQFAVQKSGLFPHMVEQMIAIGEESGTLDKMLGKIADFYEEDVDNLLGNLSSLIEPAIMITLGILIGGLVVAMYLPIFQLGAAIH